MVEKEDFDELTRTVRNLTNSVHSLEIYQRYTENKIILDKYLHLINKDIFSCYHEDADMKDHHLSGKLIDIYMGKSGYIMFRLCGDKEPRNLYNKILIEIKSKPKTK